MSVWALRVLAIILLLAFSKASAKEYDVFYLEEVPNSQISILDVIQDDASFKAQSSDSLSILSGQKHWFKIEPNLMSYTDSFHWVLHTDPLPKGQLSFYWVQSGKLVSKSVFSRLSNSAPENKIFPT